MKYTATPTAAGIIRHWHVYDVKTRNMHVVPAWPPMRVKRGVLVTIDFGDIAKQAIDLVAVIEKPEKEMLLDRTYLLAFRCLI